MSSEAGVETLSLRHGVRCVPEDGVPIEDVLFAVGERIGCENIYSASRMNKAVVVLVNRFDLASALTQSGICVRGAAVARVLISNVSPFIKDEAILKELARFGKLVGPMRAIPLGCESSNMRLILSFRRQVLMILNNEDKTLNVNFKCKEGDSGYTVFATTEPLRCFECGDVGHKRLSCPHGAVQPGSSRGDTAEMQQREDSQPEMSGKAEPTEDRSDTPQPRFEQVGPEHSAITETHTAPGADDNTNTTVYSMSTVPSADSDPAPNANSAPKICPEEVQQPQTSTPSPTPNLKKKQYRKNQEEERRVVQHKKETFSKNATKESKSSRKKRSKTH